MGIFSRRSYGTVPSEETVHYHDSHVRSNNSTKSLSLSKQVVIIDGGQERTVDVMETKEKQTGKVLVTWDVELDVTHVIKLKHGTFWGTRKLVVNGREIAKETKFLDDGSRYEFKVDKYYYVVTINDSKKDGFIYDLYINGACASKVE